MNWTLRRSRKDGGILFARKYRDDDQDQRMEWYVMSSGKSGVCTWMEMKARSSFILQLNEVDNQMVEEGFNAS